MIALVVRLDIEQSNQIGMLEIQALGDSPDLDVLILMMQQLQSDFLATITLSEIDLAETTAVNAALNRVAREGLSTSLVGKSHK